MTKLQDEHIDRLFQAILSLRDVAECYRFLEDLCTVAELKAMAQRLQVAAMLDGQQIYTEIEQKTGASSATISRVNKCLHYGEDGYRVVLDRMREKNS